MHKHYILWADDDPDDLLLVKDILFAHDREFEIIEVHNGREAMSYLKGSVAGKALPCLIILDINMPVMDGKQTLVAIKNIEAFRSIPVVVFTTSESELDKQFCKKMNVEMVTKPPSYQRLEDSVVKLLTYCRP